MIRLASFVVGYGPRCYPCWHRVAESYEIARMIANTEPDSKPVDAAGGNAWQPTEVLRFIKAFASSTTPAVVDTDQGEGYLKAMGNPAGPHALACEMVGTCLAKRLGLPTLEFAIVSITKEDEIPLGNGRYAQPGPAFITKAERGLVWSGKEHQLNMLVNPEDLSRLVLLDTWTLNCDRHHPEPRRRRPKYDNVFLSAQGVPEGKFMLKAIDHTHCFDTIPELSEKIARVDRVKDARVYGKFPEFRLLLQESDMRKAVSDLQGIARDEIRDMINAIPGEWEVDKKARNALEDLIWHRASFVAENIATWVFPQYKLGFME